MHRARAPRPWQYFPRGVALFPKNRDTMPQSAAGRDWTFRLNNPSAHHIQRILELDYHYLVYQMEIGGTGMPHVQGFVQLQDKQRLTALIKLISKKVHWEKRKGTPFEAAHYCKKPDLENNCKCKHCDGLDRFDIGPAFEDGCLRSENQYKVHEVAKTIKEQGLSRTIERFPEAYLTMNRGMEALETFYSPKRDYPTEVTVVFGPSKTGKTRYAMLGPSPYKMMVAGGSGSDFFGDYRPREHETVVLDDFYGGWKYTTFLHVADRYPTEVHTKGGSKQFLARHLIITSNSPPNEWYPNILSDANRRESFFNRLDNIIRFTRVGTYVLMKGHLPWMSPPWMSLENVNQALIPPVPQNIPVQPDLFPVVLPFPRSEADRRAAWMRANRQERQ